MYARYAENRTWGCCNCNAAYWKDNARNRAALGGLVPWQWPDNPYEKPPKFYSVEQCEEIPF